MFLALLILQKKQFSPFVSIYCFIIFANETIQSRPMKIFSLILQLAMTTTSLTIVSCNNSTDNELLSDISVTSRNQTLARDSFITIQEDEYLGIGVQEKANECYQQIMKGLASRDISSREVFPDYYGGSYLTPDDHLVVYIKGDMQKGMGAIKSVVKDDSCIIYKACDFSYQELTDIMERLNSILRKQEKEESSHLQGFGLYEKENRIKVMLFDLNEKEIQHFKDTFFDHPALIFEKGYEFRMDIGTGTKD